MIKMLSALVLFWSMSVSSDESKVVSEIKASYLYNFLQFVTFADVEGGINVCVVDGVDGFRQAVSEIQGAFTPQGKITIIPLPDTKNLSVLEECRVIYLADEDVNVSRKVLSKIDTSKVLTIGEYSAFLQLGGFIELFIDDDRVQFRINERLAGKTDFKVSSQLLSLGVKS